MSLNLYRRHFRQKGRCAGGHTPDSQTYQSDELRPKWKKCGCPIYASGKLGDSRKFRKNTGRVIWEEARAVAESWEQRMAPPVLAAPPTLEDPRMSIEDVIVAYLDNRRSRDVVRATMIKYRTFTNQLRKFAQHKGYVMIDQFTTLDMDQFYATWKDGSNSKGKKLERMKGFWKFCVKRKWISEDPSEALEPPVNYSIPKHKSPFSDDELDRIYEAAAAWRPMPWHNRGERGVITADQVIAFAMLLTETGLRISDAATFDIDRLNEGTQECFLFMHKTGKPLFTWINDDLFTRLMALATQLGPTPFVTQSTDKQTAADAWRERLSKVFAKAGPFAEHPTPHRFRHTFVCVQLARGVPVEDVAELIGDTPEMVRRHYARWVPERQKRLTNILREAYQESQTAKWRAHVVKMPTLINR